ncbi:MAG TPA: hypothetical protein PKU95_04670 [Candidatus Dojkabacteria bacterium]|nr:hypothetical protein [Candidatus Dojkabacteria bacterium]
MLKTFLRKNALDIFLVILLGFFTYFALVKRAPINMDEFSHYHPILCSYYENNDLNTFREQCGMYDQQLLGGDLTVTLRSYGYGGSLASIYYYPLFLLWPSAESARMLGFIFVMFQAYILSKLLKVRFRYALLGIVSFFPYYYQIIIDTSIIHFYTTAVMAMVYLLKRWSETIKFKYISLFFIILLLTFWSRLSFGLGFPAIIMIALYYLFKNRKKLDYKTGLKQLLLSSLLFLIPALIYIFSPATLDGTMQVWLELTARDSRSLGELLNPQTYLSSVLIRRFSSPLQATERAYYMDSIGILELIYSLILYGFPILMILINFIKARKARIKFKSESLIFYVSFLITSLLLFRSADTKHMHHVMMAYPFLFLSWAYSLIDLAKIKKALFNIFIAILVLFNLYYYITFTSQQVQIYSDEELNKVHEILQSDYLASNYFYINPNWGMFFYEGLYGPKEQSVIYIQSGTDNVDVVEKLKSMPEIYGRDLLYIYDKKVPETIPDLYDISPNLIECSLTKDYEVWGILMPPDDNELNPCK